MNENRILWGSVTVSLTIHASFFLLMNWCLDTVSKTEMPFPMNTELTYLEVPAPKNPSAPVTAVESVKTVEKKTAHIPMPSLVRPVKPLPPPAPSKPKFEIPRDLEKDMNYQKYYQLVRDRVRAYAERNYGGFSSSGIVHLAFILGQKGLLKDIQVFKEDTSANDLLRQVAIRSIKDSAPFPQFPMDLKHEELPFSIYIEFKRGEN